MEQEPAQEIAQEKSFIVFTKNQVVYGVGSFIITCFLAWQAVDNKISSQDKRISRMEDSNARGDSDKGRMENKIDKMSMDFIDLKSNVIVMRNILDGLKNPQK